MKLNKQHKLNLNLLDMVDSLLPQDADKLRLLRINANKKNLLLFLFLGD